MKKTCLVLLCTYNGEKYLKEQLDSILAQTGVEIYIKVADDCSTDSTPQILEEYKLKYPNFDYYINQTNKGFTYNFLDLFFSVKDTEYDYYAFSDQDDFWLPEKIEKAMDTIQSRPENEKGTLYCSNLVVVDSELNRIGMQEDDSVLKTNKNTYLFENIATGCTVVFDNKFKNHSAKYYPDNIKLHDYWFFLIAVYTADYIYDFNGYILYRQHGSNQIGTNKKKYTFSNFKKFIKYKGGQSQLISELVNGYGSEISEEDMQNMLIVRDYKKKFSYKMKLMFKRKFKKRNRNLILKMKVLFNKL